MAMVDAGRAFGAQVNAHREAVQIERDRLVRELERMELAPGHTFSEYRTLQRQIEHLEQQLIWFDQAPRDWFK